MKQIRSLLWGILFSLLLLTILPAEEQDSINFVIAPPPVGYPRIAAGNMDTSYGGNLIYVKTNVYNADVTILGASIFGTLQYCLSDRLAMSGSGGLSGLAGNKYNLTITQIPLHAGFLFDAVHIAEASLFLFGGAGVNAGISFMTITVPQLVPLTNPPQFVDDDTQVTSTTLAYSITAGAQINWNLGQFIVSPYGVYTYSGGKSWMAQESSMSYDYPSNSASISAYSTTIFGFDILYKPLGVSLSSQLQHTDTYNLISIALKWLLKPKK